MSAAITIPTANFLGDRSSSQRDVPFNAQLENLREIASSLLSELDSLDRLAPKPVAPVHLKDAVQQFEMELISAALARTRGNQSKAARLLGVKHTTLNAKVKRYQIG